MLRSVSMENSKKQLDKNWKRKEFPVPEKLGSIDRPQFPDVQVEINDNNAYISKVW